MHRVTVHCAAFIISALLTMGFWVASAGAQMVDGIYYSPDKNGGTITLNLRQNSNGTITGEIIGNDRRFKINARIEKDIVVGEMFGADGRLAFEAEIADSGLDVSVFGIFVNGKVNYQDTTGFAFKRLGPRDKNAARPSTTKTGSRNQLAQSKAKGYISSNLLLRQKRRALATDALSGTYSNKQIAVTLFGSGELFRGNVYYRGQTYQLEVTGSKGSFSGYYVAKGQRRSLRISLNAGVMTFLTPENKFQLLRSGADIQSSGRAAGAFASQQMPGQFSPVGAAGRTALTAPFTQGLSAQGISKRPGHINLGGQRQLASIDDGTANGLQWSRWLAGKKVTRLSGYSSETTSGLGARSAMHLCSNGQFALRGNTRSRKIGRSGGNIASQGQWKIVTKGGRVGIRLTFGNGQVELYELQQSDGKTFANGKPVTISASGSCGPGQ